MSRSSTNSDLAVVVISHGHRSFLQRCLQSFETALKNLTTSILLIDNTGNEDLRSVSAGVSLPVKILANRRQKGFAANCNEAFRLTKETYVLLLNPDTAWLLGDISEAILFMEDHPEIGVLGCRLVDTSGRQQESYRRFPTIPVFAARLLGAEKWPWRPGFYRRSLMEERQLTKPSEVDLVTGAFFLVRRTCFEKIYGFDEGFFMYYEDADFCYRARLAGMHTFFYPGITILHHHQRSSRAITSSHARWHMQSALRFFRKHRLFFRPEATRWARS